MTTLKAETKGEQNAEATTSANGIASNKRTRSQSGTIASGEARNKNGKRSASSWISSAFALNDANTLVKNEAKSTSGFPTEEQYNLLLAEIAMLQSELDDAAAESAGLQAQIDDSTECAENNASEGALATANLLNQTLSELEECTVLNGILEIQLVDSTDTLTDLVEQRDGFEEELEQCISANDSLQTELDECNAKECLEITDDPPQPEGIVPISVDIGG
eukprot:CAMPEP_0198246712 /NCGR_PEP_ID=MMETSP1446-20131203/46114_1 /TAXON_ID=1461542 ORGANISM="Unidentified sp, Strain CCMP2111" /NCGR_SAMPLE_ID=MMETSP1446 /ASSEMBLY_ACC=CAM_ASM_001112 /LENGTH=219 /DNA_ID=CAMNT_0043931035 /DNA_START=1372 /DNA_END=2031 /DNA_ORIENTATION=-